MIITATGWTIRELDATPWPDICDLLEYWAENPPPHVMLRARWMKPKDEDEDDEEATRPMTDEELASWAASVNGRR